MQHIIFIPLHFSISILSFFEKIICPLNHNSSAFFQIDEEAQKFAKNLGIRTVNIIGGVRSSLFRLRHVLVFHLVTWNPLS